ncbi:hypothetical protein HY750_02740 [Candidatus Kuenenbacteria bacterium]|nr:hypothetical protein [Candidatus Kuenenbacteria bacterium]
MKFEILKSINILYYGRTSHVRPHVHPEDKKFVKDLSKNLKEILIEKIKKS